MDLRTFLQRGFPGAVALAALPSFATAASSGGYQLGCYTRPWDAYPYEVALDGIAGLRRLIDHCGMCRCPNLMLGGTGVAALFDAYYQVVAECCDYAREKGVGLSIKPHGGTNATGPQCRRIIERVGHPSFRLWYDPGNIFYYSDGALDPVQDANTVDGLVTGMSIKDFLPPKEVLVTPGTGRVDFPKVLAALRKGGFTSGPLLVECLAQGDPATVTTAARATLRYLRKLTEATPRA